MTGFTYPGTRMRVVGGGVLWEFGVSLLVANVTLCSPLVVLVSPLVLSCLVWPWVGGLADANSCGVIMSPLMGWVCVFPIGGPVWGQHVYDRVWIMRRWMHACAVVVGCSLVSRSVSACAPVRVFVVSGDVGGSGF